MGFYFRKSINVGPFRFNLSGSGIGISVGAKGFRVGSGPHGHYIHGGIGGFYYRTILRQNHAKRPGFSESSFDSRAVATPGVGPFLPVESGDIQAIVDSNAASILQQISKNVSTVGFWPLPAIITAIGLAAASVSPPPDNVLWCLFSALIAIVTAIVYRWDRIRLTTVLMYDLKDDALKIFEFFVREFESLASAKKALNVQAQGRVYDWKRHAGAHSEIKATPARFGFGTPRRVATNVSVPYIAGGMNTVYFFPDLLLVEQRRGVGGINYRNVKIEFQNQGWIESDWIPSDGQVIGSTWRFVRRDGGPDRRFNNNRQLPILNYQAMFLRGPGSFLKVVYLSKNEDRARFLATIYGLAVLHGKRVVTGDDQPWRPDADTGWLLPPPS